MEYKQFKEAETEYTLKAQKKEFKRAKILCSQDASSYARNFYRDDIEIYESTFLLMLNRANNTIGYAKISQGGICGTVVDIRIMLKYAIDSLATGIMLVHNHPSGNLQASQADVHISRKLKEACGWMDITLMDSIILTADGYTSLADEGHI